MGGRVCEGAVPLYTGGRAGQWRTKERIDRRRRGFLMMQMRVQTLDQKRYDETFAVFVRRSEEYPAMIDRLVELGARLREGFTCLDIGAGTGKVLRDWVTKSGRRPGRYVAIEPSSTHAKAVRTVCSELDLDGQVFEVGFNPNYTIPGEFDLVLFSHSLYWMPDAVGCVQHALESLSPGGVVVVFLQGPFAVHSMYHLFNPWFERDKPPNAKQGFSSAELVAGMRGAGLTPQLILDPTPLDLTGLFTRGNERERDDFISFCLQIEFGKLDPATQRDILQYLQAACIERDGRTLWHAPNATVTLTRD